MEVGRSSTTISEEDYCPPLDAALFQAILNDLDKDNLDEIRGTLDALKAAAEIEQIDHERETAFDPSGTAGSSRNAETLKYVDLGTLSLTETSGLTNTTESSQPSDIPIDYDDGIEKLSDEEKIALLTELYNDVPLFDIQFTLKKNHSSFRKALDEILNLTWIKENSVVQKGVDGFFQDQGLPRRRKGKTKSKHNDTPGDHSPEHYALPQNVWQVKKTQIEFIASRVNLSESLVQSEYHKAGGSQRTTIRNLCKADLSGVSGVSNDDTVVQVAAFELGQDFPGLSSQECVALIILTHPFTARAHELAKALFAGPSTGTSTPTSTFIPHYSRPQLDEDEDIVASSNGLSHLSKLDQKQLAITAQKHALVREEMFSKANAAWRRARSKPLMGGVAAYYGEESRKAHAISRAFSSAAADAQVRGTATGTSIDLHGVTVQDALRNAKAAVDSWWSNGQAEWARAGKAMGGEGFVIITGAGTHSQGGKARIRPAIVKMLKAKGWRVEEDSDRGMVIVHGRARTVR